MPYGDIFVEIKMDWSDGIVEDSKPEAFVHRTVV
jgi:hypothetical protein